MEITQLRQELADVPLQVEVSDATHATEADILKNDIADLKHCYHEKSPRHAENVVSDRVR
jgi:hypothetical protein